MKKLLYFIILPQCVLLILLALFYLLSGRQPGTGSIVVFNLEIILNITVFIYYLKNKKKEKIELKILYWFLFSFIVVFSLGITFILLEDSISTTLVRMLYLFLNIISLLYLAVTAVREAETKKNTDIPVLLLLCVILPVTAFTLLSKPSLASFGLVLSFGFLCVFIFLIGKLVYILYIQNKKDRNLENIERKYSNVYRVLVVIICLILPIGGLLLNNIFFTGALGNFQNIWFYLIAVLNGLVLLIDIGTSRYKRFIFYLKTAGFTYIVYFTVAFIPYIPIGIIGIVMFGLGLFVFVPCAVFFIQGKQLLGDIKILRKQYSNSMIILTGILGILTLPVIITANFKLDGINFDRAMVYVEDSGNNVQKEVNLKRIERSINEIENTMVSSREMELVSFVSGTPILSSLYRYIAFDNRVFTEKTAVKMQKIFTPEKIVSSSEVIQKDEIFNKDFEVKISTSEKEYIEELGAYKVWVDMEITLNRNGFDPREYRTNFVLPDGAFITDYYLYVGNEKKQGIMTDKRAAQIAYESIIRTPKDPGIIYYDNDNKISLRVYPFPFEDSKTRKTGFQIMYSQNSSFVIDGTAVSLDAEKSTDLPMQMDGVQYLPAAYKNTLPKIIREPQYYFLLDAGDVRGYSSHLKSAKKYAENKNIKNPVFYSVSYQTEEIKDTNSSKPAVAAKGGFNTADAMGKIFSSVPKGRFPVIILVTNNMNRAVEYENTQFARFFPENDYFYRLNSDFSLTPYDFYSEKILPKTNDLIISTVVDYNGTAVKDNGQSEVVYSGVSPDNQPENNYREAFILQKNAVFAKDPKDQIIGIKEAMNKRILTKNTAFIVMETKEQEEMLLALQEKFLKGESNETPSVMMSESGWAAVLGIIFIVMFLKKKFYRDKENNIK